MRMPRATIAGLMAGVLFVAIACAALRGPTPLTASLAFSFAAAVLAIAALLACAQRGRARAGWAGMAASGLAYLHFAFVGGDPGYPALVTTAAFGWLADRASGGPTTAIHHSFGNVFETRTTSFVSRAVSVEFNRYAFGQVGHSLAALAVGGLGAVAGRRLADADGSDAS